MPRAELEVATYNKLAMLHTSGELIRNFAQNHSNPDWVSNSRDFTSRVKHSIMIDGVKQVVWRTPGVHISFSGFPTPEINEEKDRIYISAPPPHFNLVEVRDEVRPATYTYLMKLTEKLAEEMRDVYKLKSYKDGGLTVLTFPKDKYTQLVRTSIMDVGLLGTS